jgi:hypothetical protein
VWVVVGLALFVAALFFLLGNAWFRWFPSPDGTIRP